ncbi:MAG: NAD(+)/NADH kinase [Bacillota bacterium]
MEIKTVGLLINPTLGESVAVVAGEILDYLTSQGIDVLVLNEHVPLVGGKGVSRDELRRRADCLFCLGGDGTLLSTVQLAALRNIPVLGINLGGLGFLTELSTEELYPGLAKILSGNYRVEDRLLLGAGVERSGAIVKRVVCLNDCVVGRGALSRPCRLEVRVDDHRVMKFKGDGIIVSTPTGSTAYSFSAGGPVIEPVIGAIILTPICPHSFIVRPMVINAGAVVQVILEKSVAGLNLTVDGHESFPLLASDVVVIKRYFRQLKLIRVSERSFYSVLRKKLQLEGLED